MYKSEYQNYKYVMQDTNRLYIGVKYSFQELIENEDIPFKFRMIVERYIYSETNMDTTLESQLYYLGDKEFVYRLYKQLKLKIKIAIITERKSLFHNIKKVYTTQTISIEDLVRMSPEEKERHGVVLQEIIINKLSLLSF